MASILRDRRSFTLLEMVVVILLLGIVAKFGVELLAEAYRGYIYGSIASRLSSSSSSAVEFVAKRLRYRIRSSVIVRKGSNPTIFHSLEGFDPPNPQAYTILEWVGYDIDGLRGDANATPLWRGVIDKNASMSDGAHLISPKSDLDAEDVLIGYLSDRGTSIDDAALYLFSAASNTQSGYGYGGAISEQNLSYAMHPIVKSDAESFGFSVGSASELFGDLNQSGANWDARYYLAWSAYAVSLEDGVLRFYYDYRPWKGERYLDGNSSIIMEHVDTFKMIQKEGVIKIQICVNAESLSGSGAMNMQEYSLCKEKSIY